jgi:hypothetical protein
MPDGPVVALIVLAIGGLLAGLYFVVEHRRHRHVGGRGGARGDERLPLFGTDQLATRGDDGQLKAGDAGAPRRPVPTVPRSAPPAAFAPPPSAHPAATAPHAPGNGRVEPIAPPLWGATPPPRPNGYGTGYPPVPGAAPAARAAAAAPGAVAAPLADPAYANGETLRFALPDEGTLRFLPGRLEVVAGPDAGREIRFVAPPGRGDAVEITFGRNEGPPYRHVQLLARTVSRLHASMSLEDGHWSLQNLSATNPVVLNGRALAPDEVAPLLVDGDRVEMGEVVFTFHSR